jgi:hypothetical protein
VATAPFYAVAEQRRTFSKGTHDMARIGSLVTDLTAETASFNANIARAASNLNSQAPRMQRSLAQVSSGTVNLTDCAHAF